MDSKDNKFWATIITTIVGVSIVIYFFSRASKGNQYGLLDVAVSMAAELAIMGLIGLVLLTGQNTKKIGQGVLFGTLLTLLIGFGICSSMG